MPSAPPICCDVFSRPDASPASDEVHAGERRDRDRHEREPEPDRDQQEAGEEVAEVRAVGRHLGEVEKPRGEGRHPRDEHRLHADAVDELGGDRRPQDCRPRDREVATPVFIAE